jgi:CRP-like cAMP-binding protein
LLTTRQRHELAGLATQVTFRARATVYHERAHAAAIFICKEGALQAFRDFPSGKRHVIVFHFADDIFGLAERGRYVNTLQALTATICYRIPLEPLTAVLRRDAELQYHFLCKVIHELREQQRRAIVLDQPSAAGRLAMFLAMLARHLSSPLGRDVIPLPMSRSDIANFLGLSLESVSRASRRLVDEGLIAFQGAHAVRVVDRKGLEALATPV